MNLLGAGQTADYVNSGAWASKAIKEAKKVGAVNVVADTSKEIPTNMPDYSALNYTKGAAYVHVTSNETIAGTQIQKFPTTEAPLVADMSSDILCRPIDIKQFGLIYAGAQKNLGPSGVTLVVIRKDLIERAPATLPTMLQYRTQAKDNSLYNTPPTFGIYILMLVTRWLLAKGGAAGMEKINQAKADKLYAAIDNSGGYYRGQRRQGVPLHDERHLAPPERSPRREVHQGSHRAEDDRPEGPPRRRRLPRQHLQRRRHGGHRRPRRPHGRLQGQERLIPVSSGMPARRGFPRRVFVLCQVGRATNWCAWRGSNPQPLAPEANALSN